MSLLGLLVTIFLFSILAFPVLISVGFVVLTVVTLIVRSILGIMIWIYFTIAEIFS